MLINLNCLHIQQFYRMLPARTADVCPLIDLNVYDFMTFTAKGFMVFYLVIICILFLVVLSLFINFILI